MLPAVSEALWRKSPQWVALNRRHAELAVADTAINAVIRDHCTIGYDDLLGRYGPCLRKSPILVRRPQLKGVCNILLRMLRKYMKAYVNTWT